MTSLGSAASALLLSCSCSATPPASLRGQNVQWFRSGPYAGGSLGLSSSDASAASLDADLAARGHVTRSTLDDSDDGWKLYGGWRFEWPVSLELGYVELGKISSTIQVTTPDLDQFLRDVAEVHPFLGSGPYLVGQFSPIDRGPVEVGLRAGVWLWNAEVESRAASLGRLDLDQDGLDPLLGLVVLFELAPWLDLRAEYEKYFLEGDDADFVSLGLQLKRPH